MSQTQKFKARMRYASEYNELQRRHAERMERSVKPPLTVNTHFTWLQAGLVLAITFTVAVIGILIGLLQ